MYNYYPELTDDDFNKKIYSKKEFNKYKIKKEKRTFEEICESKNYELLPQQNLLKNYISLNTPYNGVLVFHGTGVGKTCTAIAIAEGFKEIITGDERRIIVLVNKNIKNNFEREIYDINKELYKKKKDDIVQCTGVEYDIFQSDAYLSSEQKMRKIKSIINKNYEFYGNGQFVNYVKNLCNIVRITDKIDDMTKKFINKKFKNRVIIIDEVHNIRKAEGNQTRILSILKLILKYSTNIKLVMLSATPMYNAPSEIVDLLNLLLLNDNRPTLKKTDLFENIQNMENLTPNGEKILRQNCKGYISFLRGEKPPIFPFRIYPHKTFFPKSKYDIIGQKITDPIKYLKLYECSMSKEHFTFYNSQLADIIKNKENSKNKKGDTKHRKHRKNNEDENNEDENNDDENNDEEDDDENDDEDDDENDDDNENDDDDDDDNNKHKKHKNKMKSTKKGNILRIKKGGGKKGKKGKKVDNVNEYNVNGEGEELQHLSINNQRKLMQIANIIYPMANGSYTYSGNSEGGFRTKNDGLGAFVKINQIDHITKKRNIIFRYQSHVLKNKNTINEKPFLHIDEIGKYSSKIKSILDNILNSDGITFIYSDFIWSGVLPIALALEQNGYKKHIIGNEKQLLDYEKNQVGGGGKVTSTCYKCGKLASDMCHNNTTKKYDHKFKQAHYLLLTGTSELSQIDSKQLSNLINKENNKNGEIVKVILATSKSKEGLDFKRVRQINILEPWFNLSRIEQVIGRGIRHKSHCGLPPESTNTEIFMLCNSYKTNTELIDQAYYRLSENKDFYIKKVERVLKESAFDCVLNKEGNVLKKQGNIQQITSLNRKVIVNIGDDPYSSKCDYKKNCEYRCNWEPDSKIKIDKDTYNLDFAKSDINEIKKYVKELFRVNYIYKSSDIENYIREKNNTIDQIYIYKTLELFINDPKTIVYDKYDREGKLIYRGNYYIYQPLELNDDTLPMYYREQPLNIKPDGVSIIDKVSDIKIINRKIDVKYDFSTEYERYKKKYPNFIDIIIMKYTLSRNKHVFNLLKTIIIKISEKEELTDIEKIIVKARLFNMFIYKNRIIKHLAFHELFKTIHPIGLIINSIYYYYSNSKWIEVIDKKKNKEQEKEYNDIYGTISKGKFKLVDRTKSKNALTVDYKESKRSIITGRVCNTFKIDILNNITRILKIKYDDKSKVNMCNLIELTLRQKQYTSNSHKIWFDE